MKRREPSEWRQYEVYDPYGNLLAAGYTSSEQFSREGWDEWFRQGLHSVPSTDLTWYFPHRQA